MKKDIEKKVIYTLAGYIKKLHAINVKASTGEAYIIDDPLDLGEEIRRPIWNIFDGLHASHEIEDFEEEALLWYEKVILRVVYQDYEMRIYEKRVSLYDMLSGISFKDIVAESGLKRLFN